MPCLSVEQGLDGTEGALHPGVGVSPDLGLLNLSVLWEVQTIASTSPTGMEGGSKAYRSCLQRLDVLCRQVSLVE